MFAQRSSLVCLTANADRPQPGAQEKQRCLHDTGSISVNGVCGQKPCRNRKTRRLSIKKNNSNNVKSIWLQQHDLCCIFWNKSRQLCNREVQDQASDVHTKEVLGTVIASSGLHLKTLARTGKSQLFTFSLIETSLPQQRGKETACKNIPGVSLGP